MSIISSQQILDTDVTANLVQEDLDNADDWFIQVVARGMGIPSDDVKTTSVAFQVKRTLVLWVCVEVCRRKIGKGSAAPDGTSTDWWNKKLDEYKAELASMTSSLTAELITGQDDYVVQPEEIDDSENLMSFGRA